MEQNNVIIRLRVNTRRHMVGQYRGKQMSMVNRDRHEEVNEEGWMVEIYAERRWR